eukprot:scaffold67023_cov62-Phaeocystis_antarctica.AAC.5
MLRLLSLRRGILRVLGSVYRALLAPRRCGAAGGLLPPLLRLLGGQRAARRRGGLQRVAREDGRGGRALHVARIDHQLRVGHRAPRTAACGLG